MRENHTGDETGETGRRGREVLVRRQWGASEGPTVSRSDVGRADFRIRCPWGRKRPRRAGERRAIRVLSRRLDESGVCTEVSVHPGGQACGWSELIRFGTYRVGDAHRPPDGL